MAIVPTSWPIHGAIRSGRSAYRSFLKSASPKIANPTVEPEPEQSGTRSALNFVQS